MFRYSLVTQDNYQIGDYVIFFTGSTNVEGVITFIKSNSTLSYKILDVEGYEWVVAPNQLISKQFYIVGKLIKEEFNNETI